MNWTRGFFRVWLVLFGLWSAVWIVVLGIWIESEVLRGTITLYDECIATEVEVSLPDDAVRAKIFSQLKGTCADTQLDQLVARYREARDARPAKLWSALLIGAAFWAIPPLVILAIGAALAWALNGFRGETTSSGEPSRKREPMRGTVIDVDPDKGIGAIRADASNAQFEFFLSEWRPHDDQPRIGARMEFLVVENRAVQLHSYTGAQPPVRSDSSTPSPKPWHRRLKLDWQGALAVPALVGVAAYFITMLQGNRIDPDELLAKLRQTPMIGLAMREDARIDTEVRDLSRALSQAQSTEVRRAAFDRIRKLSASIRHRYTKQLVNAEDRYLVDLWRAATTFANHLGKRNLRQCKQFFASGSVEDGDKLDLAGRNLLMQLMNATEAAVINGRSQAFLKEIIPDEEAGAAYWRMGFSVSEAELIDNPDGHSDAQVCKVALKYYDGVAKLPREIGVPFMRWSYMQGVPAADWPKGRPAVISEDDLREPLDAPGGNAPDHGKKP